MSNIQSAGGFKPPAGITSRNDGGGPGSGSFYGGPAMPYEEEEEEDDKDLLQDPKGNPFEQLTFISPNLSLRPGLMNPVKALAASAHYRKYLSDIIPNENALEELAD